MNTVQDALPGEACYMDIVLPNDAIARSNFFLGDFYKHSLQNFRSQNVMVISINKHDTHDDFLRDTTTWRFTGIKLAEPEISELKEFYKK
jgi:hypothetical protein